MFFWPKRKKSRAQELLQKLCELEGEVEKPKRDKLPEFKIFKRVVTGPDGVVTSETYEVKRLQLGMDYDWRRVDYTHVYKFCKSFYTLEDAAKYKESLEYSAKSKVTVTEV